MKSEVQDASNVRAVVAQALIHNADRSKAYDAIAAVLGESREVAKKLVFAYLYDATNATLLQTLREQHKSKSKIWRVFYMSRYFTRTQDFKNRHDAIAFAGALSHHYSSVEIKEIADE